MPQGGRFGAVVGGAPSWSVCAHRSTVVAVSIKVELSELRQRAAEYSLAYLVTAGGGEASDAGRPHLLAVTPTFGAETITVGGVGRHTSANVRASGQATLLWAPAVPSDYSLIVDGIATVDEVGVVTIVPTKAILHRPAVDTAGQRTGNDCRDL